MKFVRRDQPGVEIEAVLFDGDLVGEPAGDGGVVPMTCPDWFPALAVELEPAEIPLVFIRGDFRAGQVYSAGRNLYLVATSHWVRTISPGDWIIRTLGVPERCDPAVFERTYCPAP